MTDAAPTRFAPLAPSDADTAADDYLAGLGSPRTRALQKGHLERCATWVCAVPRASRRGFERGLRIRPRLGAVPWSRLTPQLAAHARQRALDSAPTLKAASSVLQPLRQTLKAAYAAGRLESDLFALLAALRVDGIAQERRDGECWYEHETEELAEAADGAHAEPLTQAG